MVHHQLHGSGPKVLNIGGTGGDLRTSAPERLPLNDRFTVLSFDQRGLGQTSKPAGPYTMADYADDAAALLEAVGWSSAHVVGTSFGGMVALNLALRHPEVIDRLVLCCTSPGGVAPSYPFERLAEMEPEERFATRMSLLDTRWDPDAVEPIPNLGATLTHVESAQGARGGELDAEAAAGLRWQIQARAGHDVVDDLAGIGHPTLVCAGEFDGVAPLRNAEMLVDRMPDARLEVFDGGHLFQAQDPRAFDAISDFLDR